MPTVLLVLLRSYLRLDGGAVRVRDVRYCAQLGGGGGNGGGGSGGGAHLLKSVTLRQAPDATLRAVLGRLPVRSREALLRLAAADDDEDECGGSAAAQGLSSDEAYAALCQVPDALLADSLYELHSAALA